MTTRTEDRRESKIGHRLKHARLLRGFKLRELADALDCSESFLSKVENDKAQPSLAMLHRIVTALEINIPSLFSDAFQANTGPVSISRKSSRIGLKTGNHATDSSIAIERLIVTRRGSLLEANIHVVEAGGHTDGVYAHEGEELGFILEGILELQVADETYSLEEGDSFTFRSDLPHGYRNPGDTTTRVLWVNTPPTF